MDTIDRMVVPSPLGWEPLPERPPRRWLLWVLPAVIAALLATALNVDLPYYALAPGDARQVNDLLEIPTERAFPPRGRVLMATVSLQRVKPLGALSGWLDRDIDVLPEERILGSTPRSQYRQQNLQLMDDSKQNAVVVALRRLGYQVNERGSGAEVVEVAPGKAADGRLQVGETITSVDGTSTPLVQDAIRAIQAHQPGDRVRLDVAGADGSSRVEDIVLGRSEDGKAQLGVLLRTKNRRFDLPFDVDIESGRVGGPSAGLAFTLALLDSLSAGELTGGRKVAATGTIEIDGRVGDVGGVAQKTAAVGAAGAEVFLVPPGEYEEAKARAPRGLQVMRVATLDDALAALGEVGGDVSAFGPITKGSPG